MKRTLDSVFEEIVNLGINFDKLNSSRTVEEKQKSKVNIYFIFTMAFVIVRLVKDLGIKGIRPVEISTKYSISPQFIKTCFG